MTAIQGQGGSAYDDILRYGDILSIKHIIDENKIVYLTAKGFIDTDVFAMETSEENLKNKQGTYEFNISNYRDCLFEVIPKLSYQFMNQLKEYITNGFKILETGKEEEDHQDNDEL